MKFLKLAATTATDLSLVGGIALAQGVDILGVTPVSQDAILAIKAVALGGIAFGFLRLMGGRHSIEGLVEMGIGGLGIAKSTTIAQLFGF